MSPQPFLYALKYFSQRKHNLDIRDYIAAVIAETIFALRDILAQRDCAKVLGASDMPLVDVIRNRYDYKYLKSLVSFNRDSLHAFIRSEWEEESLLKVWKILTAKSKWWYTCIDEYTISIQPFIDKVNQYEIKEGREYPIVEIICGTDSESTELYEKKESIKSTKEKIPQYNHAKANELKNKICTMYDTLVEKRGGPEVVRKFKYIWQWKIDSKEYAKIKEILTSDDCRMYIKKIYKDNKYCLFVVVACLAEYFKREWNGHHSNDILADIGLKGEIKSIAEDFFCGSNQRNRIFQHSLGNHEWLDSIMVEGGLPVYYVVNKQDTPIAEFAYNIWGDRKELEVALEPLKNKTIINSYQSGYSIYAYINEIRNGRMANICSDNDCNSDLYKNFINFLEDGRNRKIQDKFYIRYRVWKSCGQFTVSRTLKMKECNIDGYDEFPADVISTKRLTSIWGIHEPSYVFMLSTGKIKHKFIPYKTDESKVVLYRSSTWEGEFELPSLSSENISQPVIVNYVSQDKNYVKHLCSDLKFPSNGYMEFRKVNNYEWKDKDSYRTRSEIAAVLFNTDKWEIQGVDFFVPFEGYGWAEFSESVKLVSKTDRLDKALYNSTEKIKVEPVSDSIHPITRLSYLKFENNKIRLEGNCLEQNAYLLQHPVKFDAIQINSEPYRKLQIEKVEYRKPENNRFEIYQGDESFAGYVIFRVSTNGVQSQPIHCYILPSEATIKRNPIEEKKRGIIEFSCPKRETIKIEDNINYNINEDYRPINISDGVYNFNLNVARAFYSRDRFKGKMLDETNKAITIRFSNQYQVREIDKIGVRRKLVDTDCRPKLMSKLREAVLDSANSTKGIGVDGLIYQAYTKPIGYDKRLRKFYADSGNDVDKENLCFKFLALNDDSLTDVMLDVEIGTGGFKYLTLNFDNNSDGVILQSLYDRSGNKLSPTSYYAPRYVSMKHCNVDNDTRILSRIKRLCHYVSNKEHPLEDATFKHFDIVCSCGCYFVVMDRLYALTYTPSCCNVKRKCVGGVHEDSCDIRPKILNNSVKERMAKFYLGYCEYCSKDNKQVNYVEMWRMSEELCCDWLLIPRNIWLEVTGECAEKKELVLKLMKYRPKESYKNLIENYWDLKWKERRGPKGEMEDAYKFMKYILTGKCDEKDNITTPDRENINKEINRII